MGIGTFFKQLALTSLGVGAILSILHCMTNLKEHYAISLMSIVFFVVLSILVYIVGLKAVQNSNIHTFTSVIIAFVFGKMLFSVVFIVVYHQIAMPKSNLFLIPFFIAYLFYTIFETHFMIQLGKTSQPRNDDK